MRKIGICSYFYIHYAADLIVSRQSTCKHVNKVLQFVGVKVMSSMSSIGIVS